MKHYLFRVWYLDESAGEENAEAEVWETLVSGNDEFDAGNELEFYCDTEGINLINYSIIREVTEEEAENSGLDEI